MRQNLAKHFKSGWAFIPGPIDNTAPMSSLDVERMAEYTPREIAQTILAYPGMKLIHDNQPRWWNWKVKWDNKAELIELNLTLMGHSDDLWGGSEINAYCLPDSLIAIWEHLKTRHPGIWLCDPECQMHTRSSFLEITR